jgi:hypothetical protein
LDYPKSTQKKDEKYDAEKKTRSENVSSSIILGKEKMKQQKKVFYEEAY